MRKDGVKYLKTSEFEISLSAPESLVESQEDPTGSITTTLDKRPEASKQPARKDIADLALNPLRWTLTDDGIVIEDN